MTGANPASEKRITRKILVVDDHPVMQMGIAKVLEDECDLQLIGWAKNAAETFERIEADAPDLVLIDINLKGIDGIDLVKQIKSRALPVRMLVISMYTESLYAERALRAGALGYLNKQEPPETYIEAIRTVLSDKIYVKENVAEQMLQSLVGPTKHEPGSVTDKLSDREMEVFRLIGSGYTTRNIAEQLSLSVKTIETYRESIKRKLNIKTNPELIRQAVLCVEESIS